jgi:hypothetical protein
MREYIRTESSFSSKNTMIERCYVERVTLLAQMSENFLRAGGVAGAFAVDSVENVGHRSSSIKQDGSAERRAVSQRNSRLKI